MAIELELESIFDDDLITVFDIDGESVAVIAGPIEQSRSDFDQGLINSWKIVVRVEDFGNLVMGQSLSINNRDWTVDGLLNAGVDAVEVSLMRYLS